MGKMNHKGRSKSNNIVIVSRFDMRTEAYTHLSVHGRAALLELLYRFNGANNGEIQISVRQLGKALNCGKNKAGDVFLELQDKGWIKYNKKGSFDWKTHTNKEASGSGRASTWFLTNRPTLNKSATKEYVYWKAKN